MRADEYVDAVDLEQAEPANGVRQRGGGDVRGTAQSVEPLRRERKAAGLRERDFLFQLTSPCAALGINASTCIGFVFPGGG
jgi:hypothetical protein